MPWKRTSTRVADRVGKVSEDLGDRLGKLNKQGLQRSADLLDRVAGLLETLERSQTQLTKQIARDVSRRVSPPPRRRRGRAIAIIAIAGAAGYALAYLFDPDKGTGRRAQLRDQLGGTARGVGRTAREKTGSTAQAIKSYPARVRGGTDNPNPDDNTLVDRVESELFADPGVPKGRLNIGAINGKVILRGELDDTTQIGHIEMAVRKIVGVKEVENLLHTAGTPAPNKAEARRAAPAVSGNGTATD